MVKPFPFFLHSSPIAANGLMIGCPSELVDVDNVATFNRPAYYQLCELYSTTFFVI